MIKVSDYVYFGDFFIHFERPLICTIDCKNLTLSSNIVSANKYMEIGFH